MEQLTQYQEYHVLGPPGPDAAPTHAVPAGVWQAARPLGTYCLVGCTVGPGFEFEDFRFVADVGGHETAFDGVLAQDKRLL